MYLINAIYFKSTWKDRFDVTKASKQPSYLTDNSQAQTDFMNGPIDYKKYDCDAAQVFEFPYSNNKFSRVIVMPRGNTAVEQLVAGTDTAQ